MPQQNFTIDYGLTVGNANITGSSGNINTIGNISANSISLTGTISVTGVSNLGNVSNVKILGGSDGNVLITDGTGNLRWGFVGSGTVSSGTANQIAYYSATGNTVSATGTNLTWNGSNLLTVVGTVSATNLTGTLTTAAQPNITSVGTLSSLAVSGNISAGNISGTITTAAQPNITSVGTLSSLNVTGNVSAGNLSGTLITGTLATAAQPNITSIGTLSSLTVSGNVTTGNVSGATLTGNVYSLGISTFNNVTVSNLVNVFSTVDSSSTTTGAIVTAGGLGVAKNAYFGKDVNIAGNLFVTGNTTIVNANDVTIADKTFVLANNASTGALADGAGLIVGNISVTTIASWLYDHTTTSWQSNLDLTPNANASLDLGDTTRYWRNVYSANVYGTIQTAAQPNITSVGTLNSLSVTGNVSAGNLSGTLITGTLSTAAQPNITSVGTLSSLTVSGNASAGNINTTGNIVLCQLRVNNCNVATAIVNQTTGGYGNIGAAGQGFDTLFARQASANNADLAEIYVSDTVYEYGTVMVFAGTEEVTASTISHDPRIAGVVSQQPAFLMNDTASGVPIALTGRVPCRVLGPVAKGSLLVSSNLPGIACAVDPARYQPGCVIGKSLEEINSFSVQLIEVVVGRL